MTETDDTEPQHYHNSLAIFTDKTLPLSFSPVSSLQSAQDAEGGADLSPDNLGLFRPEKKPEAMAEPEPASHQGRGLPRAVAGPDQRPFRRDQHRPVAPEVLGKH